MRNQKFYNQLKQLSNEIEKISNQDIYEWIEENIIEIQNNNELVYTYGGPSIRIYIDRRVIKGTKGFSDEPIFITRNTEVFKDFFNQY